jgi:predicted lipoprotein with Yx(FWY)xxD motif
MSSVRDGTRLPSAQKMPSGLAPRPSRPQAGAFKLGSGAGSTKPQLASAGFAVRLIGAGLLIVSGAIHLDEFLTGYRSISVIGPLFLVQAVAATTLGASVLITRTRLVPLLGAALAIGTLGGYIQALWIGLFGFREVPTTAGIVSGAIDIAVFVSLATLTLAAGSARRSAGIRRPIPFTFPSRRDVFAMSVVIGAITAICSSALGFSLAANTHGVRNAATATLIATRVGTSTVVANAQGFTLYWFARDTPTQSRCTGECAAYWPPVIGRPVPRGHLRGRLAQINRGDGLVQATYDGHPLYRYVGDSGPGQSHGNDFFFNGGVWHEMVAKP